MDNEQRSPTVVRGCLKGVSNYICYRGAPYLNRLKKNFDVIYCFQQFYNYITTQFFIHVLPGFYQYQVGWFNALLNHITALVALERVKTKYLITGLNNSHYAALDPQKR